MAKPRQKPQKVGIDSVKGNNTTPILIGVGGVIVVLLVVALIIAATTGKKASTDNAVEFQPVTSTGTALAPEYSDQSAQTLNPCTGCQAPSLQGKDFYGNPVNITADGKPKVVIFFAHWCPHCQREVPILSSWLSKNASKYSNVSFYGVATASSPVKPNYPPSAWLKKENWPTPVLTDDNNATAASKWGLGAYPYIVALDGQNKVVTRTSGEISVTDFENSIVKAASTGTASTTATTVAGTATNAGTGNDNTTTTAAAK